MNKLPLPTGNKDFSKFVILFIVYFVTAFLGLKLDAVGGFATLVWAPTGIAIAALLLYGYQLWPGIFLGAFLVNLSSHAPVPVAFGMAAGNTLEAVAALYLLKKVNFQSALSETRDILNLIMLGALGATFVSATVGTISLFLGGVIPFAIVNHTWVSWWIGDMLGCLVITPLILIWHQKPSSTGNEKFPSKELALWTFLTIVASLVVFSDLLFPHLAKGSLVNLFFPLLVWASLRFNLRVNVTALFALTIVAIWGTVNKTGPFQTSSLSDSLLLLQIFMGVLTTTILVFVSVVAEEKRAKNEIIKLNTVLNEKINEERRINKEMFGELKKHRTKVKSLSRNNIEIEVN